METISAVIIAKNEEKMIEACIRSVLFCNEIIVIDNDSDDKTAEIAKKLGANVLHHSSDDFSDARNFGKNAATNGWILYVDADERVSKELARSVIKILKSKTEFTAFKIRRKNFYLGNHEWPHIEMLERFFRKNKLSKWQGKLHESPVMEGETGELEGFLYHLTHRNLSEMLTKTIVWSEVEARLRYDSHHPTVTWWRFPRVMLTAFWNSYVAQKGYRAGTVGIIESMYQSFSMFITYVKLWEMQHKKMLENTSNS